jgi:hypothetical protein
VAAGGRPRSGEETVPPKGGDTRIHIQPLSVALDAAQAMLVLMKFVLEHGGVVPQEGGRGNATMVPPRAIMPPLGLQARALMLITWPRAFSATLAVAPLSSLSIRLAAGLLRSVKRMRSPLPLAKYMSMRCGLACPDENVDIAGLPRPALGVRHDAAAEHHLRVRESLRMHGALT